MEKNAKGKFAGILPVVLKNPEILDIDPCCNLPGISFSSMAMR